MKCCYQCDSPPVKGGEYCLRCLVALDYPILDHYKLTKQEYVWLITVHCSGLRPNDIGLIDDGTLRKRRK